MKIRPILFSTEMVQAILAGRKTQTRRIIKPQPIEDNGFWKHGRCSSNVPFEEWGEGPFGYDKQYAEVGDVLWVRETFMETDGEYFYKANYDADDQKYITWKPSIFMPKAAARIFLKITNIRVERLNDISEDDAEKEGVEEIHPAPFIFRWKDYVISSNQLKCPIISFYTLWCSINGAKSWNANPFVWVIEFERIEKPLNF